MTVVATHRYVSDPEAVERALDMWARYLVEHVAAEALSASSKESPSSAES